MKKPTWIFARESEYTLSISSLLLAYFKSLQRPFLMSSIHSLNTRSLSSLTPTQTHTHTHTHTHTTHTHTHSAPQNVWNLAINENSVQKKILNLIQVLLNSITYPSDKAKGNVTTNLFNWMPYRFWGLLATNLCWNILSLYPFPTTVGKSEFDCSFPRQNRKLNHERNERPITKHCLLQHILRKRGI